MLSSTGNLVERPVVETVPVKRVLIAGLILGIFHPPVIGFVYALCFAFAKTTRRIALWIVVWTIAWTIIYGFALGFVGAWITRPNTILQTKTTSTIGTTKTTATTLPIGKVLPKATPKK